MTTLSSSAPYSFSFLDSLKTIKFSLVFKILFYVTLFALFFCASSAFAQNVPGGDVSNELEGLGALLKTSDTILFSWGGKLAAGVCVLGAGWAFKEQRVPVGVLCIIGALFFGLSGKIVKNVFTAGGSETIFSGTP